MNIEDIIRMAKIAWGEHHELFWMNGTDDALKRFANLVAAAEREVCAKAAESIVPRHTECGNRIAAAIRARGQK